MAFEPIPGAEPTGPGHRAFFKPDAASPPLLAGDLDSGIALDRRRVGSSLAYTALFNTVVALFLTAAGFGSGIFWEIFVISQCIGLTICTCVLSAHALTPRS